MNKTLSLVIGVVAVLGLVLGGVAVTKKSVTTTVVGEQGPAGPQGPAGKDGRNGSDGRDGSTKLGSVTGPDSYLPYQANNNLQKWGQTIPFTVGTTTVCAIKSPNATSTLIFGSANFVVSSTTATVVTLAKSASPGATTTPLNIFSVSANASGVGMASTTPLLATGLVNSIVFAPNQFFVVGMAGGIGTFSPTGTCSAEFIRN